MITSEVQWDAQRWPNFSFTEMRCQETGEMNLDPIFMDRVQKFRTLYDHAVGVASGYRSPEHSIERTKEQGPGTHTFGRAWDPVVSSGSQIYQFIVIAIECGFTGIGIQNRSGIRRMHLDDLDTPGTEQRPRPTLWTY